MPVRGEWRHLRANAEPGALTGVRSAAASCDRPVLPAPAFGTTEVVSTPRDELFAVVTRRAPNG
ncbi:hypothetical protein ACIRBZ_11700 [Streptomyces sp. NPDC094038]|uniref:hypothetical protein n=1 Tax=Streptomyces sp. NPDC094038 TaxID=3366055 RepID=UPI003800A1DC